MSVGMTAEGLAAELGVEPKEAGIEPEGTTEPQVTPIEPTEPTEPTEPVTPTEPAAEGTTPPTEGGEGEPAQDFRSYFDQEFGDNLSSQYATDQQATRGLHEARKKLRERDATASWGQQVQQRIAGREQEFEAFLSGKQTAAVAAPVTEIPLSYDQAQLLRQRAQQDPSSLTPAEQASLVKATDQLGRQAWDLSQDPEKVLKPILEKYMAEAQQSARQATQQDMAAMQEATTAQQWANANKEFVWVDGDSAKGFTPGFHQYNEFYNAAREKLNLGGNEAHEYARFKFMQGQPPAKPTQPVKQAARRKPAVAAAPVTEKTPDEMLEEGDFVSAMVQALTQEKASRQLI